MKVEFTKEEAEFVLNAINTHLKEHGLGAAQQSIVVTSKLQYAAQEEAENKG